MQGSSRRPHPEAAQRPRIDTQESDWDADILSPSSCSFQTNYPEQPSVRDHLSIPGYPRCETRYRDTSNCENQFATKFGVIKQTVQFEADPANPKDVFEYYPTPAKHIAFTGSPATTSRRMGAKFTAWDGYISGKNLKLVKDKKIVQEWKTCEWSKGHPSSKLEFNLAARKGGTEVKMTHSRVPAEPIEKYREGWRTSYWTPLGEYLAKQSKRDGSTSSYRSGLALDSNRSENDPIGKGSHYCQGQRGGQQSSQGVSVNWATFKRGRPQHPSSQTQWIVFGDRGYRAG